MAAAKKSPARKAVKPVAKKATTTAAPKKPAAKKAPPKSAVKKDAHTQELEQKLMDKLGFKVQLNPDAIVIPYAGNAQLTAILRRLGVI